MRRILSVLLCCMMLFSLAACGRSPEQELKVEEKSTIADTNEALGYDLLTLETAGTSLQFSSTAIVDDDIGQVTYQNGKSAVTLRMTLNKDKAEGLAGYENSGTAGAIDAPADVFSKLSIQVVDNSVYFCEFSYTNCGCTCYLSLAETKTNLDLYSVLLISYINQLYNAEGIPSFVYVVDPSLKLDQEAPEASGSAESSEPETDTSAPSDDRPELEDEAEDQEKSEDDTAADQADDGNSGTADEEPQTAETTTEPEAPSGTISLEYYDITLINVGDAYTFSPSGGNGTYSWSSSDSSVASVSADGTVTAVGSGTATVTVTSGDGLSANITVRVK